jgi:serine/threonine protein kinase
MLCLTRRRTFVGCGVFGKVYRGLCRGQVVAVKVPLNQDEITDEQLAEFRAEVAIMRKIYHFSVVLFLGACTQPHRIMIVTQFMAGGSLDTLLKSDTPLSFDERIGIAKDVALGLAWLHNISKIVHRDLKPANLLLNSNRRCKITDFGFAQLRQLEHKRETQPRGSVFLDVARAAHRQAVQRVLPRARSRATHQSRLHVARAHRGARRL